MNTYYFFRKDGFYRIVLSSDASAMRNAEMNAGTIRVEDRNGLVIWEALAPKESK